MPDVTLFGAQMKLGVDSCAFHPHYFNTSILLAGTVIRAP